MDAATGKRNICLQNIILLFLFVPVYLVQLNKNENVINVLQWLPTQDSEVINYLEDYQKPFQSRKCKYQNCYVTTDSSYLRIEDFDAILFNVVNIEANMLLPSPRKANQKYIFYAKDPAATNIIPDNFDDFFNLTWTYKLDSDISTPCIIVTNKNGELVGPKRNMNWKNVKTMEPIEKWIEDKLKTKKRAVAWMVDNCRAKNRRLKYVEDLDKALFPRHKVDIYGCEFMQCPKDETPNGCNFLIESDYYFLLTFETAFCEDCVTETVLQALQHFAVPVVYGGANYTRFLPDGSYLNAQNLDPQTLAERIIKIIDDQRTYYNFFKWHRYYNINASYDYKSADGVCEFCFMMNKKSLKKVHKNLFRWWNGPMISTHKPRTHNVTTLTTTSEIPGNDIPDTTDFEESGFVNFFVSKLINYINNK